MRFALRLHMSVAPPRAGLTQALGVMNKGPPYSRRETEAYGHGFPDHGIYCSKCKGYIPEFDFLDASFLQRIRTLSLDGQVELAQAELIAATGCSPRWAKIWVVHSGEPHVRVQGPPCPYCGGPLRTARARQCPHCLADWHDA
jgi:hypothetical protein